MTDEINFKCDVENEDNFDFEKKYGGVCEKTDDYEIYIQRYQEYSLRKRTVDATNANDDAFLKKLTKKKCWIYGAIIGGVAVGGIAVGLPLHFVHKSSQSVNNTSINNTSIPIIPTQATTTNEPLDGEIKTFGI